MPRRRGDKPSDSGSDRKKRPVQSSRPRPDKPDKATRAASVTGAASPVKKSGNKGKAMGPADSPQIIQRDGVAYLDEYDIPIWQLEMGRRAGAQPASTIAAFPGLSEKGLELAFDYARKNREEIDALIREYGPTEVPEEDEGEDDEAAFEAELEALLETDAELFRRLAR
jgi:uncharacterized protein (DUF433 family)